MDIRLKDNIKEIQHALEKIQSIRGVEFDWNKNALKPGRHDIGLITQDVKKVFPTTVVDGEDGYKRLDYAVLVSPLIEAVKELKSYNQNQHDVVEKQNHDMAILNKEMAEMEDGIHAMKNVYVKKILMRDFVCSLT